MPRRRRHRQSPEQRAAEAELAAERAARARRRVVLRQYARLHPATGTPILCIPTRAELTGLAPRRTPARTDGRPIYDTREAADAAARALEELGARPLRPFECPRSDRRHHLHLTTDRSPAARRARAQEAPQCPTTSAASKASSRAS